MPNLTFNQKYRRYLNVILSIAIITLISRLSIEPSIFIIGLCGLLISIYQLYSIFQYERGHKSYLLIPTLNDNYYKTSNYFFGTLILAGTLLAVFLMHPAVSYVLLGLCLGIATFLNGVYDLPKGKIETKKDTLFVTGMNDSIHISDIKDIKIKSNSIHLTTVSNSTIRLDNFNIDAQSAFLIYRYLSPYRGLQLTNEGI